MDNNNVNLLDTWSELKKNKKLFFILMGIALTIGIILSVINTKFFKSKIRLNNVEVGISAIHPLDNVKLLHIFSTDTNSLEGVVKVSGIQDKISNYFSFIEGYFELVSHAAISQEINQFKIESVDFNNKKKLVLKIIDVEPQDVDKLSEEINNLIKKANLQIIPIIAENIKLDNSSFEIMISQFERDKNTIEKKLEISKDPKLISDIVTMSSRISDLKSILKIRNDRVKFLSNSDSTEIFYLSNFDITEKKHTLEVNNKSIILASLLLFFSVFLFYIIIKR